MSEEYTADDLIAIIDETTVSIIEGLLIWMDMSEALINDREHSDDCDGNCSMPVVDEIFDVNKRHLDNVVESFRNALIEITAIKDKLTSDASEVTDE